MGNQEEFSWKRKRRGKGSPARNQSPRAYWKTNQKWTTKNAPLVGKRFGGCTDAAGLRAGQAASDRLSYVP